MLDDPPPDYRALFFAGSKYQEPLPAWEAIMARKLLKCEVTAPQPARFRVDAQLRILPGLRYGFGWIGESIYNRTRPIVAADNDDVVLLVNLAGRVSASQCRRDLVLEHCEATILACNDVGVYRLTTAGRLLTARLPFEAVASAAPYDAILRRISRDNETLRFLISYLRALNEIDLPTPELREAIVRHIHDMVRLLLSPKDGAEETRAADGLLAARKESVKSYISHHLNREDLTIESVATRHRLSVRQVQRLFEQDETTFSKYLQLARLERAYSMLADPGKFDWRISEIAYAVGFGDVSHFNRAFKKYYGAAPSDVRNGRLAQA